MALYEGLTEYDPKTLAPIPAVAERWESNTELTEFTFYLRKNARWSNGDPITAQDFVYSLRRGLNPATASRTSYMAYAIVNAQGYNEGGVFAKDRTTGQFLMDGHLRKVFPGDDTARAKMPELAGKEIVPIKDEDVGVVAVDDYTVKYSLVNSAPYFVGMMPHQFFKLVPRKAIEQHGDARWTQPGNIITSGPFKLKEWIPYDRIVVERDPMYWDAANVKLDAISFYPMTENPTTMNLYKAGAIDASHNHTVPNSWIDLMETMKDYMDAPEMVNEYYQINTTKPPMNDARVRRAFSMAVDRVALAKYRHAKPLYAFVPEGVFAGYRAVHVATFDVEQSKKLLAEAGYRDAQGNFDPSKFPANEAEVTYNTSDSNRQVAEFLQAQWKQNLGVTIPIKNMEWKTFLATRAALDYKGLARSGWIGDYVDPYSYLSLFYTPRGDNGTGWWDPKYVAMLDDANRTLDPAARYEKLAKAETLLLESQAVLPLTVRSTSWMKKPYVKGMYPNPGTMHAWKFVYIERDPAKWDHGVPDMIPDKN